MTHMTRMARVARTGSPFGSHGSLARRFIKLVKVCTLVSLNITQVSLNDTPFSLFTVALNDGNGNTCLQSAVCIFPSVFFYFQSAVCSPQSRFYTD